MAKPITSQTKNAIKQRAWKAANKARVSQWNREWIQKNRARYNASKWAYRDKVKAEAIAKYSQGTMRCAHCGYANIDALCLDHINDDGTAHRKALGIGGRGLKSGWSTYERLKALGYPPGLQVLCANCNLIKEIHRKRAVRVARWQDADQLAVSL